MAIASTTLTAAISATRLAGIPVSSTVGFVAAGQGQLVKIDNEFMYLVSFTPTTITVRHRGSEATQAVAHDTLAPVVTGSGGDFPAIAPGTPSQIPPSFPQQLSIGQDATISVPLKDTSYYIDKASAAAITLTAGTAAQIGIRMTFIVSSAFAHALTYADGFLGGTRTVATFTAKIGASLVVQVGLGGTLCVVGGSDDVTFSL